MNDPLQVLPPTPPLNTFVRSPEFTFIVAAQVPVKVTANTTVVLGPGNLFVTGPANEPDPSCWELLRGKEAVAGSVPPER